MIAPLTLKKGGQGGCNWSAFSLHANYKSKPFIEGWSFGIRPDEIQNVDEARGKGAEVVVLLSHNGFDVDQKLATEINGIDVVLTGHTHDAVPEAIRINNTLILSSGSHGKYLGRIDLKVSGGKVVDANSSLFLYFLM